MRRWAGQEGAALIIAAVILVALGLILVATDAFQAQKRSRTHQVEARPQLEKISTALVAFAKATGYLPCPADGTDLADADPDNDGLAMAGCGDDEQEIGIVPWRTIGLSKSFVTDPWGSMVSYRVDPAATADPIPNGSITLCRDKDCDSFTDERHFVLVSHGPTGRGAFNQAGAQAAAPGGDHEVFNLCAPADLSCWAPDPENRYYHLPATAPPANADEDADFFDDVVVAGVAPLGTISDPCEDDPCLPGCGGDLCTCNPDHEDCKEDCTDKVFTNAVATTGGPITIHNSGQLVNLPSRVLDTDSLSGVGAPSGCDGDACEASGGFAQTLDIPDAPACTYPTCGSSLDIKKAADEQTLGADTGYSSVRVRNSYELTLSGPMTLVSTGDFTLDNSSTVRVSGDVTIYAEDLSLGNSSSITFSGGGTLTIILSGNFNMGNSATLNSGGDSGDVAVLTAGSLSVGNSARAAGYLYSEGAAVIDNSGEVTGAVTGESITVKNSGKITYSDDAPAAIAANCP